MPSSGGDIWLAAAVAGVVTLLIEYAAKPALDARKERLLSRHREVNALAVALRRLRDRLYPLIRPGEAWDGRRTPRESSAALKALDGALDRLSEAAPHVPVTIGGTVRTVLLDLRPLLQILAEVRPVESDFSRAAGLRSDIDSFEKFLNQLLCWFDLPRYRVLARSRVERWAGDFLAP